MSGFYMPHNEASEMEANVKASIVARAERIWDDVYAVAGRDAADDAYQAYIAEQIKASGY